MDKNQKAILMELMNHETMSGNDLSHFIQMSTRTVRTIIKTINEDIVGAKIISGTFGYKLSIDDPEIFLQYLQQDNVTQDAQSRFDYLFQRFIDNQNYIKIDDLCEELYLSRTQLKQSLKELRSYFNDYDLIIETKPHYGMYLDGTELNKRRAIAHFQQYQKDLAIYQQIKKIIMSCIANADYVISDDNLDNLVSHLYIAYMRVCQHEYALLDHAWLESIQSEKEYELASAIMSLMSQILNMEYREEEVAYLTMHLCGKNCKQQTHLYIDQTILTLVNHILQVLENESHIAFTSDLNLQLALSLHIIPLMKRIQYSTYMNNPLLQDIKRNLIVAYELAIKVGEIINSQYHCFLPEDEIAYFALHINLSLEQKKTNIHQKNILLICSSGVGSARLLEYFFRENFSRYIQHLKVCSLHELSIQDISSYDCIFTTVPITQTLDIPIFMISHLMNTKDTIHITHNLQNLNRPDIMQYFPPQLFFTYESFATKEEAIHEIIQKCRHDYDLPDSFEELVLEREQLATTEFNDLVAFPHSHKPVSSSTFVSVTILKKALLWKNHKIRIILLSSIENNKMKDLDDFYEVISTIMSDQSLQWQLLNQPTYETLKSIIERLV